MGGDGVNGSDGGGDGGIAAIERAIDALEAQCPLGPLIDQLGRARIEQRKLVTVLFSDFTVLSQHLDPEDTRDVVNEYFRRGSARPGCCSTSIDGWPRCRMPSGGSGAGDSRASTKFRTVCEVLRRDADERAARVAELAGAWVRDRAELIGDDELGDAFLAARAAPAARDERGWFVMDGVGTHYRASRERLTDLLVDLDAGGWSRPVPACPGWRVHDVVAHLVGVIEDAVAGRLDGPPDDSVTAEEVRRHRDDPPAELLARWQELAPLFEEVVTEREVWPAAFDALSHEHDIRGALGRPGFRDDVSVQLAATLLIEGLDVPAVVHAELEHATVSSPPADGPQLTLRTTAFEVLRFRLGRRSRDQVLELEWSQAPGDVVDELFVFGPRPDPLVE